MNHHVVIGAGPVGSGVAELLARRGTPVTVITRSGSGPDHPLVTKVKADAADTEALVRAATGATAIYNCANPPYHRWPTDWPPMHVAIMTAAERTGAVVVMMDNLYGFGEGRPMPMREGDQLLATGAKGAVRARMANELLIAHADGRLRATLARASDFYGPGVVDASLGERVVANVLKGKKVLVLGRTDIPHSVSYMPDVVTTMVTIALDERAWGSPWHVPSGPAVSQRMVVQAFADAAGTTVDVGTVPKVAISVLGVVKPAMAGLKEVWYQFDRPWVMDATLTEQTFGLCATPLADGAAATVAWWRDRAETPTSLVSQH
jgi:nucleoside-diphosphate-sugar epimerase